jgi:hypothetical protein
MDVDALAVATLLLSHQVLDVEGTLLLMFPKYHSGELNFEDEELMEQQWLKIVNYENCNLLPSTILHVSKNSSELKVD